LDLRGGLRFAGRDGSRRQYRTDWNNFSPRIGFASTLTPRLVLRSGFGVLYSTPVSTSSGDPGQNGFFSQTDWVSSTDGITPRAFLRDAYPTGLLDVTGGSLGLLELAGQSFNAKVPSSFASIYNLQWHFSVQRDLPGESLVEVSYLGNRGLHLTLPLLALNQLRPQSLAIGSGLVAQVPNPFFGVIQQGVLSGRTTTRGQLLRPFPQFDRINDQQPPVASSTYHGLGLRFQQRSRFGHLVQVSYTAAKLIDNSSAFNSGAVQNVYDLRAERAVSAQDISQRVVLSFVAPLPFGKGQLLLAGSHPAVNAILGGWQLSAIFSRQTGLPLAITAPDTSGSLGGGGLRPNSTGKSARLEGKPQERLQRFFDTAQFLQPVPFTFGNTGRTLPDVRGPGLTAVDLSLLKDFRLNETWKFQFRVEAFNLTNTPVFGQPGQVLASPAFGVITSQINAPRQIQLALRLDF